MNAEQARKLAEQNEDKHWDKLLDKIYARIDEAAREGMFYTSVTIPVRSGTVVAIGTHLREQEYIVGYKCTRPNTVELYINWSKD